jgi:hypothetical protein
MEKLRLPKAKVPKWTRAVDLRWRRDARSRTPGMKYSGGKRRVKVSSPKVDLDHGAAKGGRRSLIYPWLKG